MSEAVIVTGGAGFIGSNFVPFFCRKYPETKVITLDALTYAGDRKNLAECEGMPNHEFVKGDICDEGLVDYLFESKQVTGVIHFAAESHVDNSIKNPGAFVRTNVQGTQTLLEAARRHWMDAPGKVKEGKENCRFHHVSTDEVYGTLGATGLFTEETPYAPNSPYSASKAASDMLVRAYRHTYGMNVTTSNCSNNYGPKQHREKLIPHVIDAALAGAKIPVYGNGSNIRDWLYVLDHCEAIDLVFRKGRAGETYNVGGRNERDNNTIVAKICDLLDERMPKADGSSYKEQIAYVQDRAGHDKRYAIDATKLETELGWKAKENFDTGIVLTVDWYLNKLRAAKA